MFPALSLCLCAQAVMRDGHEEGNAASEPGQISQRRKARPPVEHFDVDESKCKGVKNEPNVTLSATRKRVTQGLSKTVEHTSPQPRHRHGKWIKAVANTGGCDCYFYRLAHQDDWEKFESKCVFVACSPDPLLASQCSRSSNLSHSVV
uniref:Secreted protein n=1 Tax=Knipowitschia caucasica TaxID=637954 RepID=A0AAV2KC81_KNICA